MSHQKGKFPFWWDGVLLFRLHWLSFTLGARPGEKGSALISCHTGIWKNGSHSIFDNLHNLKVEDKVYVEDENGITRTFIVQETVFMAKMILCLNFLTNPIKVISIL